MHNECGQAGSNPIFYYTFGREPTKTHVPSAGVPAVLPSAQRVGRYFRLARREKGCSRLFSDDL